MKRILIFSICIACLTSSCSKLLDKEPDFVTAKNYFRNENELMNSLNGVYNRLIDTYGRMYSRGLFSYFVVSDEAYFKNISINNIRVMVMDAADLDITRLWETLYEGINRANLLLENVDRVAMDVTKRNAIKGEALFMRGYYYYILTDFFGKVPLKLSATQSPNDPYPAQATLAVLYTQIVKDMQEAENLVHESGVVANERVSKTAVQAILARVFLKMAGQPLNDRSRYQDVIEYTDKVIASGKHLLNPNYKQIFINHSQDINEPKECLWEVGMFGNKIGNIDQAGMVGIENGIECPDERIGYSGGAMRITAKLYDLFGQKDTMRRDWSISPYRFVVNAGVTQKQYYSTAQLYDRNPGKWRREYETGTKVRSANSTNFPIIRYSDVLLMKAEAENELNESPNTAAYEAVNQVRRRAFGKPVNVANIDSDAPTGMDKIAFLDYVKDERLREFCFEGIRRHDLIRWGTYVPIMNALGRDMSVNAPAAHRYGGNAGLNTTERNVLFPIPNTEITINKQIIQNPGW